MAGVSPLSREAHGNIRASESIRTIPNAGRNLERFQKPRCRDSSRESPTPSTAYAPGVESPGKTTDASRENRVDHATAGLDPRVIPPDCTTESIFVTKDSTVAQPGRFPA